jgi:hypothetical protein
LLLIPDPHAKGHLAFFGEAQGLSDKPAFLPKRQQQKKTGHDVRVTSLLGIVAASANFLQNAKSLARCSNKWLPAPSFGAMAPDYTGLNSAAPGTYDSPADVAKSGKAGQ